jgi:hypothetical protein
MAALFTRKPTNQRLDASLGRCGQDVEWRVPLDTGRCHSDEGTTAIRPHERQYGPDDMKKPVEFRFDGQMPFLQINAAHIGHGNIGAGRKDKRMQSIKAFSELPDGVHHGLGISQIHAQGMRPHPKRGKRDQCPLSGHMIRPEGEGHIAATLRKAKADALADATASSDDHCRPWAEAMPRVSQRSGCRQYRLLVAPEARLCLL